MRVDFYLLAGAAPQSRERFVCRLAELAWQRGNGVYIYTPQPGQANFVDRLLWTFRDISFVPHDLYPQSSDSLAPVRIGSAAEACPQTSVLITLAPQIAPFFQTYARIAEVLDSTPAVREAGRARYRAYREWGAQLEMHEIAAGA